MEEPKLQPDISMDDSGDILNTSRNWRAITQARNENVAKLETQKKRNLGTNQKRRPGYCPGYSS
ncbi:hypothetical protein [Okeania sp. KiyG1]|uniref:hypothetical protein n=1 Tax=Okeania sp. KiyG1 TaxID=2720165 RepID=UPI001922AB45|nr:hypothetical protein [Okeania sp. KiyG1]